MRSVGVGVALGVGVSVGEAVALGLADGVGVGVTDGVSLVASEVGEGLAEERGVAEATAGVLTSGDGDGEGVVGAAPADPALRVKAIERANQTKANGMLRPASLEVVPRMGSPLLRSAYPETFAD